MTLSSDGTERRSATPPPGTIPASTAVPSYKLLEVSPSNEITSGDDVLPDNTSEVNVEPKDYVKEWDKPGLDQGPMNSKQYSQYMKYQLSQGGMAIPGRLERGKPEDLGVEGGLTEDAKKKLDQVLNNFSDRVFDAKKRNVVFSCIFYC